MQLTDEQKAIVDHDHGPALVFAVAGAGKTTTMVHRIERLVRQKVFAAKTILATSFSRATVADIKQALEKWRYCYDVRVLTLHSVGNRVLQRAKQKGYLDNLKLNEEGSDLARMILGRTLAQARQEYVDYLPYLENLDKDDFLTYVSVSKGNLAYADLKGARLPSEATGVATQAVAPETLEWYLDLYQRFEATRLSLNLVTFDDMLMTGWEVLIRYPDILKEIRGAYQCVLVDEYQDVNLAQAELLDLITFPKRNYMAIGDDDQTIYEWRGANPSFVLGFKERYEAKQFLITDNFRSSAPHLALANRVIEHNVKRQPKRLSLTRGFEGEVQTFLHDTSEQMAFDIVRKIQLNLESGLAPKDIAVLVRLYAQTSYLEFFLIQERVPYHVVGSVPFYQRNEIVTLVHYLRLALLEKRLQNHHTLGAKEAKNFKEWWEGIVNKPVRYINNVLRNSVTDLVTLRGASFVKALVLTSVEAESSKVSQALEDLAELFEWLAQSLDDDTAHNLLKALTQRTGYQDYVLHHSGFAETGEAKLANVTAFLSYSDKKGTVQQLLEHLDHISFNNLGKARQNTEQLITITSVFRAKGLEWPLVIVPHCNEGYFPFGSLEREEEERRLFYVALTRAKEQLHLHTTKEKPTTRFLEQARYEGTLADVTTLKNILRREPSLWSTKDTLNVAALVPDLHLDRFVRLWWQAPGAYTWQASQKVQHLYQTALERGLEKELRLKADNRKTWNSFGDLELPVVESDFPDLKNYVKPPQPSPVTTRTDAGAPAAPLNH
jgi:DNA helicase II / ATP-dependent DNA helicase PcrA